MAMNYDAMADEIIRYVGGSGNIRSLTHCITRLRFVLKDEEKADTEAIEVFVQNARQLLMAAPKK